MGSGVGSGMVLEIWCSFRGSGWFRCGSGVEVPCVPGWVARQGWNLIGVHCCETVLSPLLLGNTNWAFSFSVMSQSLIYILFTTHCDCDKLLLQTKYTQNDMCLVRNAQIDLVQPHICVEMMDRQTSSITYTTSSVTTTSSTFTTTSVLTETTTATTSPG